MWIFSSASFPVQLPAPGKPLDQPTRQARVHQGCSKEASDPPFSCSSLAPKPQFGSHTFPVILALEFEFAG